MSGKLIKLYEENDTGSEVIFKVQPEISESGSVNYIEISEIRQAASILIYIGSPGRQFNINAKLVSRTEAEADKNYTILHRLKSWRTPNKGGTGSNGDSDTPPVLRMMGYGMNFKHIRLVMKSITADFPTDCDYITAPSYGAPMPIIMPIALSFQEVRSADELMDQFDFKSFRAGILGAW